MQSHTAHLGIITTVDGKPIDQCVITIFRAPASYTGEDTVEISIHGSPWIQREVLKSLIEAGASAAGPGEFTQMAFLNGRMDLAQAEAVADLLDAESRTAARVALNQIGGSYSSRLNAMREKLIELGSLLELELDFSEEDVEFADREVLRRNAEGIRSEVVRLMESYGRGKVYKEGVSTVLAGVPNAGKSSLLNCLTNEDKALVTPIAGTTRDVIEATAEIGGILFRIYDTAGIRESEDMVENLGIGRAIERIRHAVLILWLEDPTQDRARQTDELKRIREMAPEAALITVHTKGDLAEEPSGCVDGEVYISSATGQGIETLRREMVARVGGSVTTGDTIVTNLRHYEALRKSLPYLDRLLEGLGDLPADLLAEELRGATRHIGVITGAITTPDLLSTIFSRFCIGK